MKYCAAAYGSFSRPPCAHQCDECREHDDAERMDWLSQQNVTIRNDNLLLVNPTNLRMAIDIAMTSRDAHEPS
jgi:hypothetical protein